MLRLLFIDAYDSFTNNIIALLRNQLSASVITIKIDDQRFVLNDDAFLDFLQTFDAVVAGPGPGHPATPKDVGLIGRLWCLPERAVLPVLGICLGFQSLCLAFGAQVERLREPRHGMVTPVIHRGADIFESTGDLVATQYHSLHVRLASKMVDLWTPAPTCRELVPLAWDLSDLRNGPILMAVRHCRMPFWGLQFHPESVCTNDEAQHLTLSWAHAITAWTAATGFKKTLPSLEHREDNGLRPCADTPPEASVNWTTVTLTPSTTSVDIVEMLRNDHEPLLLESGVRNGTPVNPETGRFSIVGIQDTTSLQICYSTANHHLRISKGGEVIMVRTATIDAVFDVLEDFMQHRRAAGGSSNIPFWGGLIGYISYEAGLETIDVLANGANASRPDVCFVYVERSVVIDHRSGVAHVQTVRQDDEIWLSDVTEMLTNSSSPLTTASTQASHVEGLVVSQPAQEEYCDQVRDCQSRLRAGSSYELCLTDQTMIRNQTPPWNLYLELRKANPAPFGAYLRLQNIDILGSSPERFLSWDRRGTCQFRPIKGTVKKTPDMTRKKAEELLASPKERAENLMIVDLIRHDLHGVPG